MTVNFGSILFNKNNYSSVSSANQSAEVTQSSEMEYSAAVNPNPEEENIANKLKAENNGESIYKIANDIANGDYSASGVKCSKNSIDNSSTPQKTSSCFKYIDLPKATMLALKELILRIRNQRPNTNNNPSGGSEGTGETGGTTPTGGNEGTGETGGTTPTGGNEGTGETGGTTPTGGNEGTGETGGTTPTGGNEGTGETGGTTPTGGNEGTGETGGTTPSGGGDNPSSGGLENFIGSGFNYIWYTIAKTTYGPDAAGMLDLAHERRNDTSYEKDATKMSNWNDNSVSVDKDFLRNKVATEFNDYGFDVDTIPGYFFPSYSDPCKRIAADADFLSAISNRAKVLDNTQDLGMGFTESNLHYALGHVAIRNRYVDSDGNLHVFVYDTYDFNSSDTSTLSVAGRNAMMNGELKPYFTVHEVVVPKSKLDTLWG